MWSLAAETPPPGHTYWPHGRCTASGMPLAHWTYSHTHINSFPSTTKYVIACVYTRYIYKCGLSSTCMSTHSLHSHHSNVPPGISGVVSHSQEESVVDDLKLVLREAFMLISSDHAHCVAHSESTGTCACCEPHPPQLVVTC